MRLRKKPWIEEAMQDLKGEYVLMHDLENYKGRWQELFPGKRLCLEIGCGKGRFIIGMAELHPEKAFIGVETQHDIAYYPGKTAKENKMDNIKVICEMCIRDRRFTDDSREAAGKDNAERRPAEKVNSGGQSWQK